MVKISRCRIAYENLWSKLIVGPMHLVSISLSLLWMNLWVYPIECVHVGNYVWKQKNNLAEKIYEKKIIVYPKLCIHGQTECGNVEAKTTPDDDRKLSPFCIICLKRIFYCAIIFYYDFQCCSFLWLCCVNLDSFIHTKMFCIYVLSENLHILECGTICCI